MKSLITKSFSMSNYFKGIIIPILFLSIILIPSCSSVIEQSDQHSSWNQNSEKSFTFKENGENWRVDFDDDEISALYKNGIKVPDEEIDDYKEMIYNKLGELNKDYDKLTSNVHRFYFDSDKFEQDMHKFKKDFDSDKYFHFKLDFDEEEFGKNMEKLEEQLKNLKDKKIELYFDSEEFKENMKELEENLKNLPEPPNPPDIDIHIDMDHFKEGMKNLGKAFRNFDLKIDSSEFDMSELKNSMKELQKNLKGIKIDLKDLKGDLKKLNLFLEELKSQLVADGYIKSENEDYDLEMSNQKTIVNNIPVKDEHHKNYLNIYKRHFDKDIEGTIKIKRD